MLTGTLRTGLFGNDWAVGQALILNQGRPARRGGFRNRRGQGRGAYLSLATDILATALTISNNRLRTRVSVIR